MLHIEQVISLYCGGPGSGRHKEFGTFKKTAHYKFNIIRYGGIDVSGFNSTISKPIYRGISVGKNSM